MKKLVRLAAHLYPSSWRHRYGAEFDALLQDTGSGWRDVFDVLGGAIGMQLSTWSFRNVTVACGLLGLIIAAGWAFSLPNIYVSRAMFRVDAAMKSETKPAADSQALADHVNRISQSVFSRSSLSEIIQRPGLNLYKSERKRKPLEDVIEHMKEDILINLVRRSPSSPAFFDISFRYPDPIVAQEVTTALEAKFMDTNQRFARNADPKNVASLDLLDPASLPRNPTAPNRWQITLLGLLVGLLAGILIAGIRRWPWIAGSGLIGLIVGYTAYFAIPKTYVSHAVLLANTPQQVLDLTKRALSDEFLKNIIESESLYPRARTSQSMNEIIRNMRSRDIRLDLIQPHAIAISYRYTERYKAQHVVLDIENALFRAANQDDASVAPNRPLEFLDRASMPEEPNSPRPPKIAGAGMGLGLLCGLLAKWFRRTRYHRL